MKIERTEEKKRLRAEIRKAERELPGEEKTGSDREIINNIISTGEYISAGVIFTFVGTEREINTRPLIEKALSDGKRVCVPLCTGSGIMEAREIKSLGDLRPGSYGIFEPEASSEKIEPDEINLAIVPCVSCSREGKRLGQGGGYYDRFMEKYKGPAAVICREALMRDEIPTEEHDYTFSLVITDMSVYR